MVFETQPDQINIKSEEEKLQKLLNKKQDEKLSASKDNGLHLSQNENGGAANDDDENDDTQ